MNRDKAIIAELAERVPELSEECQTMITPWIEVCQRGSKEPFLPADIEYWRALQANNPEQCKDEIDAPLACIVFESSLFPLLIELLNDYERHARLKEIMDWLEELQGDDDFDVRNLVGISICEQLLGNHPEYLPKLLPFMGEDLRESCRECFSSLRVSDENKRLLNQSD